MTSTEARARIARIVYGFSPVTFEDRVDGICFMSWEQALDAGAPHVRHAYEAADAILLAFAADAPPGWRLVPVEPTPEMEEAALRELSGGADFSPKAQAWDALRAYRAMLSAAPTPEAAKEGK